ncbi:MAG TPA: hypothetical protein PKD00_01320 [Burkholderiales bacterium]|nr:hypothetical protein [Burkholderiales bacterium]
MGKTGKISRKMKKAALKKSIKMANAAKYAAWKAAGQNSKSKRFVAKLQKEKIKTVKHLTDNCGNIGCRKCDPCKIFVLKPKNKGKLDIYKHNIVFNMVK